MRRALVRRCLLGIPCGIAFGHMVAIILSLVLRLGYFMPCPVSLPEAVGGEMNAVILQTGLCGLLGSGLGAASLLWRIPRWKPWQKAAAFLAVALLLSLPAAFLFFP